MKINSLKTACEQPQDSNNSSPQWWQASVWKSTASVSVLLFLAVPAFASRTDEGHRQAFGPLYKAAEHSFTDKTRQGPSKNLDVIRRWNEIAINASGLDHTPVAPGENRVFGEQLGPGRASRAMAIVHIAMFDTANSVVGEYQSYTSFKGPRHPLSLQAAVSQAAHDTLAALFPSQA